MAEWTCVACNRVECWGCVTVPPGGPPVRDLEEPVEDLLDEKEEPEVRWSKHVSTWRPVLLDSLPFTMPVLPEGQAFLRFKCIDGQFRWAAVNLNDPVQSRTEELAQEQGCSDQQLRLIFRGQPMIWDKSWASHGIAGHPDETAVHMIMQSKACEFRSSLLTPPVRSAWRHWRVSARHPWWHRSAVAPR